MVKVVLKKGMFFKYFEVGVWDRLDLMSKTVEAVNETTIATAAAETNTGKPANLLSLI